jgi:hypothetical protein
MAEHARFLDAKTGGAFRMGGIVAKAFASANMSVAGTVRRGDVRAGTSTRTQVSGQGAVQGAACRRSTAGLRALPCHRTGRQARRATTWPRYLPPRTSAPRNHFTFRQRQAVRVRPQGYPWPTSAADRGRHGRPRSSARSWAIFAGLAWRGFETFSQISAEQPDPRGHRLGTRSKIFGRDTSRV